MYGPGSSKKKWSRWAKEEVSFLNVHTHTLAKKKGGIFVSLLNHCLPMVHSNTGPFIYFFLTSRIG